MAIYRKGEAQFDLERTALDNRLSALSGKREESPMDVESNLHGWQGKHADAVQDLQSVHEGTGAEFPVSGDAMAHGRWLREASNSKVAELGRGVIKAGKLVKGVEYLEKKINKD